jgi:hypothetical protein
MTIQFSDGTPATQTEFDEALKDLVFRSHENGVSVLGSYECRGDETEADFEVLITEVELCSD